ncbi:MAG: AI-2E family transporter [Caldilineaceae bacterium]|nr:AI-2E family transporter [Caldilineaceae bacterium]
MSEKVARQNGHDPVVAVAASFTPHWTMRTVVWATLIAVGIGLGFLLLYQFYMIVFLVFVAFSLATALRPLADWLRKRNLPLALGILPFFLGLLGLLVGFVWLIGPLMVTQLVDIVQELPSYYTQLRLYLQQSSHSLLQLAGARLPVALSLPIDRLPMTATAMGEPLDPIGLLGRALGNLGKTLFLLIGVLLLAYYWLVEGDMIIRRSLLRTRFERRTQLRALIMEIEDKIGGYFRGQLLLCLIIGLFSLVAFWLLGVPNALSLALINGVTEAIPVLGPTIGAVPAILLTLSTDPSKTPWVVLALLLIQGVENNFLVPRIMDRSVGVHPLITILSIAAFGLLFGIVGAILAIPLAAILQILVSRLLFSTPTLEESTALLDVQPQPTRSRFAVLRHNAQELAQDVRKQARHSAHPVYDAQIEQAEDMIESVASRLENYLAQQEQRR